MNQTDNTTRDLIETIAKTVIAHTPELTDLDRAIGDADHGVNLERGFKAVLQQMETIAPLPLPQALNAVGTTLLRQVGGASGPLYGKLFVTLGKSLDGAGAMTQEAVARAAEEAIAVLKSLGHSDVGQKTLLDVLVPALDELRSVKGAAVLQRLQRRVTTAAQSTTPMIARRGRAAFLGERSQGHMDPGARSCELIVRAACRYLETRLRKGPIG